MQKPILSQGRYSAHEYIQLVEPATHPQLKRSTSTALRIYLYQLDGLPSREKDLFVVKSTEVATEFD